MLHAAVTLALGSTGIKRRTTKLIQRCDALLTFWGIGEIHVRLQVQRTMYSARVTLPVFCSTKSLIKMKTKKTLTLPLKDTPEVLLYRRERLHGN